MIYDLSGHQPLTPIDPEVPTRMRRLHELGLGDVADPLSRLWEPGRRGLDEQAIGALGLASLGVEQVAQVPQGRGGAGIES